MTLMSNTPTWRSPMLWVGALLLGFLFATVGTAVWPDGVLWSSRILCSAPYHLSHAATGYSYGTHSGSAISFSCVDGFGDSAGSVGFVPILMLQWALGTVLSYVLALTTLHLGDSRHPAPGPLPGARRFSFGGGWQPAKATIVGARALSNWSRNSGGVAGSNWTPWEYVADVRPTGQAPFRATFHEPLMHGYYDHPREGQVVDVLYRPRSGEVKLGDGYKVDDHARRKVRSDRFKRLAEAAPGTSADSLAG